MRQEILKALKEATGLNADQIKLDFSDKLEHGDYTTNVAMKADRGQGLGVSAREKAEEIVKKLEKNNELQKIVAKIEIAGPGFINFFLDKKTIENALAEALVQKNEYGKSDENKEQKVIIEYTDPNPFKELHIGHLYSNIVGESISRLIESQGATVKRACYQGDVGLHVAKSIWGMRQKLGGESITELEKKTISEKVKFLGQAYALGATAYDEDEVAKREIIEINKQVFEKDSSVKELYEKGRTWSLEYFDLMYKRIGTKFDYYFFESEVSKEGVDLVKSHMGNVFEESDGALVFKGEKYGLHTRVFVNKLGLPTYEAKELALASYKYKKFEYDKSLIITASEINEYFKVLLKALSLINPQLAEKTTHIGHGFVKLPSGKMSSRTGNIVTAESVLDEAYLHAIKISKANNDVSEKIGQAAVKYAFLKNNIGGDIEFDLEKSVSFNGNSGPYLQYTAVRAKSILAKSELVKEETIELGNEEAEIARVLIKFPEVVANAASIYAPSMLCTYLYEVAQSFNSYYDKVKIIGTEEEQMRLKIVKAVSVVLEDGLKLLGIEVPDRM